MKILFFGDIVGKIGRRAVAQVLPELKKKHQPDIIIANVENIAHGTGVTAKTLEEVAQAGVDYFTSGNHIFKKPEALTLLERSDSHLLRPANYPTSNPGSGLKIIAVGSRKIALINLVGQVFMKEECANPFRALDELLIALEKEKVAGIIVDFHGEATSEKVAFGWYADGRISAVVGTHTHVPTADATILPHGTAYITDIGMVGAVDSVIGVTKEPIIKAFLGGTGGPAGIPETGPTVVNAVLLEIDPTTSKATNIARLDKTIAL